MKSEVGKLLCSIKLKNVTNLKVVIFLAAIVKGYSFPFDYEGFHCRFKKAHKTRKYLLSFRRQDSKATERFGSDKVEKTVNEWWIGQRS